MKTTEKTSSAVDQDQAKKPKLDLQTNEESVLKKPEETCSHWLKRKKRYCRITVAKGSKFCGEHLPQEADKADEEINELNALARIPCPLDPKHTVYKKNLGKHLKICNARPKEIEPPYIQKNINAGELETETTNFTKLKLSDLSEQALNEIIKKVQHIYESFIEGQIQTLTTQHKSLDYELSKTEYGKETRKHLIQTAALLGILEEEALLKNSTSFIEFGAGKGQLAFYLAQLIKDLSDSKVILLDRMSLRHKKDNKIEDRNLVERIRVDIADFKMNSLDLLSSSKQIVAVSKHLCGAATDLTLRCITQAKNNESLNESFPATEFIMIALCCHHRCDWRTFVGKDFFKTQGISPKEFIIITKMVSWAICGTGMSRERRALEALETKSEDLEDKTKAATYGLSLAERERIGFMCKRILDLARLKYLEENGYEACLKYYVTNDVTLENVCLLARKNDCK